MSLLVALRCYFRKYSRCGVSQTSAAAARRTGTAIALVVNVVASSS